MPYYPNPYDSESDRRNKEAAAMWADHAKVVAQQQKEAGDRLDAQIKSMTSTTTPSSHGSAASSNLFSSTSGPSSESNYSGSTYSGSGSSSNASGAGVLGVIALSTIVGLAIFGSDDDKNDRTTTVPEPLQRSLSIDTYTTSHDVLLRGEAYASDNNILGNLTAGSCVRAFADTDGSREYLEVRLMMDGTPRDGWVHKRYLNPNPTAPNPCAGTLSPYTP